MASTSITQTTTPPKYYDFYDEAIIYVRAGSGGQGATTFQAKGGKPNGGHGGKGGDILLQLDSSVNTLSHLNNPTNSWIRSFRAPNGADGKVAFKNGKWADNVIIPVPSGTIVQELPLEEKKDDEEEDETTTTYIKKRQQLQSKKHTIELSYATNVTTIRLAKGGEGGDGNAGSATHPGSSTTRRVSPQGGERKRIQLILKIVGDGAIQIKERFFQQFLTFQKDTVRYRFFIRSARIPHYSAYFSPGSQNGEHHCACGDHAKFLLRTCGRSKKNQTVGGEQGTAGSRSKNDCDNT